MPEVCLLDPDGDIVRALSQKPDGAAARPAGPVITPTCYEFVARGEHFGIIGCAVGASVAVLARRAAVRLGLPVADQHDLRPARSSQPAPPPYFVLIDRALRDEGTSYHYSAAGGVRRGRRAGWPMRRWRFAGALASIRRGASWTTDAPFRETAAAIERCRERHLLAVEMEAAGLYAFARARRAGPVLRPCDQPDGRYRGRHISCKGQQGGANAGQPGKGG